MKRKTKALSLHRETLRSLNLHGGQLAAPAHTDVTCSTCDPRRPCCPQ
jgi:hypothetical protein